MSKWCLFLNLTKFSKSITQLRQTGRYYVSSSQSRRQTCIFIRTFDLQHHPLLALRPTWTRKVAHIKQYKLNKRTNSTETFAFIQATLFRVSQSIFATANGRPACCKKYKTSLKGSFRGCARANSLPFLEEKKTSLTVVHFPAMDDDK